MSVLPYPKCPNRFEDREGGRSGSVPGSWREDGALAECMTATSGDGSASRAATVASPEPGRLCLSTDTAVSRCWMVWARSGPGLDRVLYARGPSRADARLATDHGVGRTGRHTVCVTSSVLAESGVTQQGANQANRGPRPLYPHLDPEFEPIEPSRFLETPAQSTSSVLSSG